LVLVFPDGDAIDVVPFFFLPADRLRELAIKFKVPYDVWARQGHLTVTRGATVDYAYIRKLLNDLTQEFDLRSVTYDRWNSSHLVSELRDDGLDCVPLGQGIVSLNAPMKLVEKMAYDGTLRHDGNPVLTWNVASTVQVTDAAGNVKPDKEKSTGGKVDGVFALLNAMDTYSRQPKAEMSYSIYVI
jgi:phage terminase large subunit-like protein